MTQDKQKVLFSLWFLKQNKLQKLRRLNEILLEQSYFEKKENNDNNNNYNNNNNQELI